MEFILTSIILGIGLAMDAFSVSLANGLNYPQLKKSKSFLIALTFALFQIIMPLIGWFCVHSIATAFEVFKKYIPWIAFALLLFIGIKMIIDGIKGEEAEKSSLSLNTLLLQGVATSIDALSVGFTISNYDIWKALFCSLIIGIVTLIICLLGVFLGKKIGTKLSKYASFLGGGILIIIGIKIFIEGVIL